MTFTVDPAVIHESARRGDRWYPYAVQFLIPEANTQAKILARLLVLHSMAGPNMTSLEAIRRYYERDDIHTESTFALAMSGEMAQFVPIDVRADCQADANGFAASVETQDRGYPTLPTTAWTPEQVEQLAGLSAWMHLNPRCDLALVDPAIWNGTGVGYHSEYARWSIYVGKTCPGAARIAQMPAVRARATEIVAWRPAPVVVEPPPTTTLPPPEDTDVRRTLFIPADCDAQFIGWADAGGNAIEITWVTKAVADAHRSVGVAIADQLSLGGFANCVLLGPLPVGDTRHTWTGAEFFRWVPGAA